LRNLFAAKAKSAGFFPKEYPAFCFFLDKASAKLLHKTALSLYNITEKPPRGRLRARACFALYYLLY